jgi:hypothetical protein
MRTIISYMMAIAIVLTMSCHPKLIPSKNIHTETTDSRGNKMLLGTWQKEKLMQEPYSVWFNKNYSDYVLDTATCKQIKQKISGQYFVIFMGTWCGDSKREVPRMFKILDFCGVKSSHIRLTMLNNADSVYKQSPAHEEQGMNIHRVPDLIVLENKKEIGRIVESPVISLEKDLLAIIDHDNYSPNYKSVAVLIGYFEKNKTAINEEKIAEIVSLVKPFSRSSSELNTFGYVKMAAHEMDKAEIAFRVNAVLYPGEANMFDSLGDFFMKENKKESAKDSYSKALQLDPKNENTRKKLVQLQNN